MWFSLLRHNKQKPAVGAATFTSAALQMTARTISFHLVFTGILSKGGASRQVAPVYWSPAILPAKLMQPVQPQYVRQPRSDANMASPNTGGQRAQVTRPRRSAVLTSPETHPPPRHTGAYNLTSTFEVEKTFSFLATLSPEQREMFAQLSGGAVPMDTPPPNFQAETPDPSPDPSASLGNTWFNTSASSATGTEVLLFTILLAMHLDTDRELDDWMLLAESDAENMNVLGEKWAPPSNSARWNSQGNILLPLENALHAKVMVDRGDGRVETAAAVMAEWRAARSNVSPSSIDGYLKRLHKTKGKRLAGPKRDRSGSTSARYVSAIPAIASLLRGQRRALRASIKRLQVVVVVVVVAE